MPTMVALRTFAAQFQSRTGAVGQVPFLTGRFGVRNLDPLTSPGAEGAPGVGSDLGPEELMVKPAVKIQPQNPMFRLTHRVSHIDTLNLPAT